VRIEYLHGYHYSSGRLTFACQTFDDQEFLCCELMAVTPGAAPGAAPGGVSQPAVHGAPPLYWTSMQSSVFTSQATGYVLEQCWRKYSWGGFAWLHNSETDEWFWKDDAEPWQAFRGGGAVWWLNGERWF